MKKFLKVLLNVVIWIFVIFALLTVILTFSATANDDGIPSLFGKSLIAVQSDSMKPEFSKGDLIIDNSLTAKQKANMKKGDIITFLSDLDQNGTDELNTHRIIRKYEENGATYYETQGDNKDTNKVKDEYPVRYDMVVGQYTGTKLSSVGSIIDFLQTRTGFLVVIVIPLGLFFIYELYNFIKVIVNSKKNKTAEEEDEIKRKAVEEFLKQQEAAKANSAEKENDEAKDANAEKVDEKETETKE